MCHAGAVEGPEFDVQMHGTVHLGSGAEEMAISGKRRGGSQPWIPAPMGGPRDGGLLQIPGAGNLVGGKRLAGVGEELVLG